MTTSEPSPASLLVAGDTHGDVQQVRYLIEMAHKQGCSRVVQVGDFGYWPHIAPFHEKVNHTAMQAGIEWYWLDGNHENFDALQEAVDFDAAEPQQMLANLWYLPRGCTWEWDGVRFMALGGAYSIDKEYRREGHSWWPQELLTREQVERAMDRGPVDVLFTHDAPEGACPMITVTYKGDEISRGNRKAVGAVVDAVTPRLVVHGHYHHRYSTEPLQNYPRVVGLGRDGDGPDSWITLRLAELATDSTCGFCGQSSDTWPSKDCEEPQQHTTAVYDCDCGDVVTIAEAVANPKRHRRCHLIGASE